MKKYQPSNGTEGMAFTEKWCDRCKHQDPRISDAKGDIKSCEILLNTMIWNTDDNEYPEEWTYDKTGYPMCTKWSEWNWIDGPPVDPDPVDPNQLKMF